MDVLSDVLHRARAGEARIHQLIQRPPWSVQFADPPSLAVVAALGGTASVRLDGEAVLLAGGDIALISRADGYTIADAPDSPPQVVIRGGYKQFIEDGSMAGRQLGPRTYGDGLPGSTVVLHAGYRLRGEVGRRLLAMLPGLAVLPAGPRTRQVLELLSGEVAQEEPGQDAVLGRLLDLVLVLALRALCAQPGDELPHWRGALADPGIGEALRLLHERPAHRWTVAELAASAGQSRSAFAARFSRVVGEPPLGYLTGWRMTLAADLLRETEHSVEAVAREVGYADAFAFSTAFKRAHGVSPSVWRRG
ncbi:AraC family transcriptional regulator [Kitasatospora viridis]|uniref:AraC-like DNA-binding protein n=1 Tax=Kitasatospora viridis TaxID=281105 RepID=A0A561SG72_9ACTN|nr:AraC family transcriptional regulator [Kitasatospora viridis]TWF73875.1 AraC-like DNA-binding protein [Kitasatospora viridis]